MIYKSLTWWYRIVFNKHRNSDGIIVMFDLTRKNSIEAAKFWIDHINLLQYNHIVFTGPRRNGWIK